MKLSLGPSTRRLLREALFRGLEVQFAMQRHDVHEIEQLIDEPGQRAIYLRLMANGLEGAGEYPLAWKQYLSLIELDRQHPDVEHLDRTRLTRRDRWIQVRMRPD